MVIADQALVSRLPENSLPGLMPLLQGAADHSNAMKERQFFEDEFEGRRMISRASKRPRVSTTLDARKEDVITESGLDLNDRAFYSVTLTQPVYHWGALESQKRIGELGYDIIKLGSLATFRSLLLKIRSSYLDLLVKKLEIEQHEVQYDRMKANLEYQRERQDAVSLVAIENMEIELSQMEINQMDRRSSFEDNLFALVSISGVDTEFLESKLVGGVPEFDPISDERMDEIISSYQSRLEHHPAIEQKMKDLEVAEHEYRIADSRLKPKLNLTSGLTQFNLDDRGVRRDEELAYAGLEVRWNIFDGNETEGHRKVAFSNLKQAELNTSITRDRLENELKRLKNRLRTTSEILVNQELRLKQRIESVSRTKEDLEAGRASRETLSNAEQLQLAQEIATQRARVIYLNYLSELTSLIGLDPFAEAYKDRQNN